MSIEERNSSTWGKIRKKIIFGRDYYEAITVYCRD